jgi:hypothetical protein
MSDYAIKALDASTWDAFACLAEKHNGAGFGCWCTWFHSRDGRPEGEIGRAWKERLVREGNASRGPGLRRRHRGGVVPIRFSGGASAHLPPEGIRGDPHGGGARLSRHVFLRRQGLSAERRRSGGASWCLDLIAKAGGGVVEGYPRDTQGKKMSATFLYSAMRSLFEEAGFGYDRPKGKFNCVMRRTISPGSAQASG